MQVLDRIDYTPFDIRIAPPAGTWTTPERSANRALTAPAAEAQVTAPASIQLKANASDSGGGIQQVDFFAGTRSLAPKHRTVQRDLDERRRRQLHADGARSRHWRRDDLVGRRPRHREPARDESAVTMGDAGYRRGWENRQRVVRLEHRHVLGHGRRRRHLGHRRRVPVAYQPLSGDGQIVARVATVQNTNAWVKAGVMIGADVSAGSAQAMMMVTPGKGNNFQRRPTAGGASVGTAGLMVTAPYWVKLTRVGTLLTAYQSIDGTTWSQVGTQTIAMPTSVLVGLAVSSHSTTTLATATFDQVAMGP